MSFLSDTLLPGTASLFFQRQADNGEDRALKRSRSHARLLTPLAQLIKSPARTVGDVLVHTTLSPAAASLPPEDGRKQVLYLQLRDATSYEEWRDAATALDTLEGNDAWKLDNKSDEYNAALVAARLRQLDEARISCDVRKMMFLIRTSLTRGLGGMGDLRLYKHSHIGTKALIEQYIDSTQSMLSALLEVAATQGVNCPIDPSSLVEELLLARQSFGRSALLLSGGGTFGMNHIGVVKCLWERRLLPRIISGASAGSIVCSVLCSKTDEEIPQILDELCHGDLAVFEREGEQEGLIKKVARFLKYGALFDISLLMNVMRGLLGDITFQESYNRTRRILNITVSSSSVYELPRLLNYVTAPNVMIWSAVCASCSVPLVFSAASLLAKDPRTGREVPWNQTPNATWIDGSVDNDLPMTRLAEMFNVNHFIVSQVNPHVIPFLAKEEEAVAVEAQQNSASTAGPAWFHDLANLAKGEASHRLHVLAEMGILPNYLTKARSVINQRYSGDITIFPAVSYSQFPRVLRNPTPEFMEQALLTGERATWPKLSRIQNHLAIELALDETIRQLRARAVFRPQTASPRHRSLSRTRLRDGAGTKRHHTKTVAFKHVDFPKTPPLASRSATIGSIGRPMTRLPSAHAPRPYLSTQSPSSHIEFRKTNAGVSMIDAFPSSTAHEDPSSDDDMLSDSETSISPPHSPSSRLWPSNRTLFPFASQPATPSHSSTYGQGNSSSHHLHVPASPANGSQTPTPLDQYQFRFFHPPPDDCLPGASQPAPGVLEPTTQSEVVKSVRSIGARPCMILKTESAPETQKVNPIAVVLKATSGKENVKANTGRLRVCPQ